ncbi:hypothetical protein MMIC_P1145 [Mariprofundus micogutta]|uniref:Uncharacterized protein n=1 Tax=Mariprofundus micogutta TaxID=1921010 RepID=A0A1L8CMP7_9PROT|nr:hypothetical protein [Mariprofundus micogutta]GAV20181.1 hypothetical protein MMIC_P1145 [Mariprofundus micogutta]
MVKHLILILALLISAVSTQAREISQAELQQIAELVFQNECAAKESCLTSWNRGEEFASLGIGHFIWYPAGVEKSFQESFPALMQFMVLRGEDLPDWLSMNPLQPNPWQSRAQFLSASDAQDMKVLRQFLRDTKPLQAEFMQQRLSASLPKLLHGLGEAARAHISAQFERVAESPMGMYVLMDYVNFKGEGIALNERYQGMGWGLLQVLGNMSGEQPGLDAIKAFAQSADQMLTRRVSLSPPARHEARWLPGWRKRLATYEKESRILLNKSGL